jgi:hypothetical protein
MYANTLQCDYVPPAMTEVKNDVRRKYEGLEPLRSVDNWPGLQMTVRCIISRILWCQCRNSMGNCYISNLGRAIWPLPRSLCARLLPSSKRCKGATRMVPRNQRTSPRHESTDKTKTSCACCAKHPGFYHHYLPEYQDTNEEKGLRQIHGTSEQSSLWLMSATLLLR